MNNSDLEAFRAEWRREVTTKARKQEAAPTSQSTSLKTSHDAKPVNIQSQIKPEDQAASSDLNPSATPFQSRKPESEDYSDVSDIEEELQSMSLAQVSVDHQEATQPLDAKQEALSWYQQGVEKELRGLLSEALTFYRKAFRRYPSVDRAYQTAFRAGEVSDSSAEYSGNSLEESGYAKFIQIGHDYDPKNSYKSSAEFEETMRIITSLHMPIETQHAPGVVSIASLPDEILQQILSNAITASPPSFTAISLTCQKFCLISQYEQSIWKNVCLATYRNQVYTEDMDYQPNSVVPITYSSKLQNELAQHYQHDWKRMFMEKSRIRMNGCYIATCHYTRPGVREESYMNSFHLVTYFRFLRFYPDGTSLSLLTTSPPADVVHQINLGSKLKDIQIGKWSMTRSGKLSIEATGPASYLFFMSLQVKSSSRGRQNKLQWDIFNGTHPVTGEVTHFNLKNDKPFYFSRVRSYAKKGA